MFTGKDTDFTWLSRFNNIDEYLAYLLKKGGYFDTYFFDKHGVRIIEARSAYRGDMQEFINPMVPVSYKKVGADSFVDLRCFTEECYYILQKLFRITFDKVDGEFTYKIESL